MKNIYKFFIGCLIIIVGWIFVDFFFQFSVRKSIENVNSNKPYCLLIVDATKHHHWADLKPASANEIHFFNIVFINNMRQNLYETPPHILLITENKSYLWSMRKWRFIAYEPGSYVSLNEINNKKFIKNCK